MAASHRVRLPELRALAAHDRARQRGLRPAAARPLAYRGGGERPRRAGAHRPGRPGRAPSRPALRRPAAARFPRSRTRAGAGRAAPGRAALEPRRAAAGGDAPRDPAPAARGRHHHHLRHPRPGGGSPALRRHRGDEPGARRAGGDGGGGVRAPALAVRGHRPSARRPCCAARRRPTGRCWWPASACPLALPPTWPAAPCALPCGRKAWPSPPRAPPGALRATVTECAYLGHAWKVVARVGDGLELTAYTRRAVDVGEPVSLRPSEGMVVEVEA